MMVQLADVMMHVSEPQGTEPDIADGVEHMLDPATVAVGRLIALIWVGVLGMALWFGTLMFAIFANTPVIVKMLVLGVLAVATACWIILAIWWPKVRYERTRYCTDPHGFTIRRGVLWRGVTSIPKRRVQHTDVVQGPVQRRFGLGKLVIHTAGTQDASVSLSGLPYNVALAIRDFLIDGDAHDVG
jgi:membrane protein YdbS with pleckstrin-like domain